MAIVNDDDLDMDDGRGFARIPRDLLDADDPHEVLERHRVRRAPIGILLGILIGLGVAGGIGWYIFDKIPAVEEKGSEIPLIKAANEPFKVKPDDPGGMDVPNRDKLIYQQIGETAPPAEEERLLPPAETPATPPPQETVAVVPPPLARAEMPHERLPEARGGEVAPSAALPPAVKEPVIVLPTKEAKPVPAPTVVALAPVAKPVPVAPVASVAKPIPVPAPVVAKPQIAAVVPAAKPPIAAVTPAAKPVAGGANGIRVQLVALRSADAAEKAWAQLAVKHKDVLGGLSHWVVQAELGDKGTWYRVHAGSFSTNEAAVSACETLKQRNIGCILVKK